MAQSLLTHFSYSKSMNLTVIFTAHKRSFGKVIFSQVFVCHTAQGSTHVIIIHDALGHGKPPPHPTTTDTRHGNLLLLTSGGHHWRPFRTCSLEDLPPSPWYWHVVVPTKTCVLLASKRYPSYWNVVLYKFSFCSEITKST